jgi:uncharacterized protein
LPDDLPGAIGFHVQRLPWVHIVKATVVVSAWTAALLVGCHRNTSSQEHPAPSASVITLGLAIGTCDNVEVCERECDAGSADRCRRLGATYALGRGASQDETRATALYEQACNMNDPSACLFAGQMNEFARGVAKDDVKAARFYERSCDLQWAAGCYNLAIVFERGTGVRQDRARAGELYQKACTAGAKSSCEKAKEMHEPPPVPFLDGGLRW